MGLIFFANTDRARDSTIFAISTFGLGLKHTAEKFLNRKYTIFSKSLGFLVVLQKILKVNLKKVNKMNKILLLSGALLLSSCFDGGDAQAQDVALGKSVFEKNCVTCHGKEAAGTVKNWKKTLPNGKYPAPPLNGSAHAWHHSPKLLLSTLNEGGAKFGGWMPPFKNQLSAKEKQAVLDYLHSLWPADIQQKYDARFK